jgi:hypothetical protein
MNDAGYLDHGQEAWPQAGRQRKGAPKRRRGGHTTEYLLATVILLMIVLAILGV